jgi:hypothetical protein
MIIIIIIRSVVAINNKCNINKNKTKFSDTWTTSAYRRRIKIYKSLVTRVLHIFQDINVGMEKQLIPLANRLRAGSVDPILKGITKTKNPSENHTPKSRNAICNDIRA